jgi:DNA end-binding protein Ku
MKVAKLSSSERVSFRQINRKTGNRLRQQFVDDETRQPVDSEDKVRGYEIGKNTFLLPWRHARRSL